MLTLLQTVALAVHLQDVDMMGEAIEEGAGQPLGAEDLRPLVEGQVLGTEVLDERKGSSAKVGVCLVSISVRYGRDYRVRDRSARYFILIQLGILPSIFLESNGFENLMEANPSLSAIFS